MAASKSKKVSRGKLPQKRSINLAASNEKPLNIGIAIPAIILIVLAAVLFSKFAVIDRLSEMSRANAGVSSLRDQISAGYDQIDSYGELTDKYAHYTYSGMTEEELSRVDRVKIIELIEQNTIPGTSIDTWSVRGNEVSMTVEGSTLQQVNQVARQFNASELVSYCNISTATKTERRDDGSNVVTASMTVFLVDELTGTVDETEAEGGEQG